MQISIVRNENELRTLSESWNDLLSRSATDVPFLRHEYMLTWWSTLGGGEWQNGDLCVGIARDHAGSLMGIAPLFQTRAEDGRRILMFLGSVEISDYLDLIVPEQHCEAFVEVLLQALTDEDQEAWDELDLYNIPEASPSLDVLEKAGRARGWEVTREQLQPCPVVSLEGTWEEYLSVLDKKQRHELRRKIRRAEENMPAVQWRIVGPQDDITHAAQQFLTLMSHDPHKEGFLTDAMRTQFQRLLKVAQREGWLHLSFLEVGSEVAAGYLNFDYRERIWVYNSGMNPDYLSLSPGWVLLGYLIQWATEKGRKQIDFLRGRETYKYRLGGVDTSIYRLTMRR